MNREILYHVSIQHEIREILNYYEGVSKQLADDFWEELTNAFEYARQFPNRQHFVVKHNSRDPSYGTRRSWKCLLPKTYLNSSHASCKP